MEPAVREILEGVRQRGDEALIEYTDKFDGLPTFSPDGTRLAFVAKDAADEKGVPQLHVMPLDGGEARCLTDLPLGVGESKWLPNGTGLIVSAPLFLYLLAGEGPPKYAGLSYIGAVLAGWLVHRGDRP